MASCMLLPHGIFVTYTHPYLETQLWWKMGSPTAGHPWSRTASRMASQSHRWPLGPSTSRAWMAGHKCKNGWPRGEGEVMIYTWYIVYISIIFYQYVYIYIILYILHTSHFNCVNFNPRLTHWNLDVMYIDHSSIKQIFTS